MQNRHAPASLRPHADPSGRPGDDRALDRLSGMQAPFAPVPDQFLCEPRF